WSMANCQIPKDKPSRTSSGASRNWKPGSGRSRRISWSPTSAESDEAAGLAGAGPRIRGQAKGKLFGGEGPREIGNPPSVRGRSASATPSEDLFPKRRELHCGGTRRLSAGNRSYHARSAAE